MAVCNMKSSELRIGNCIDAEIFNGLERLHVSNGFVTGLLNDSIYINDIKFEYRHLKPIPLTEEWLLKFGFEQDHSNQSWHHRVFVLNSFEIQELSMEVDKYSYEITTIKYVHQLQNLYFALTGEELTIKDLA